MVTFDTEDNQRSQFTDKTLESLRYTVDFNRHRLFISDNGSCEETQELFKFYQAVMPFTLIENGSNIGTANAINRAWAYAGLDEPCVKMDNDVTIVQEGWADLMHEAFERTPNLGIVGLKRKDCIEMPGHSSHWYNSTLEFAPHEPGERWLVLEYCRHIMGTCQAYRPELLDKIGYLYQMGSLYGFDDALASLRAHKAGFKTGFLHGIEIDHIDPGGTAFTQWKIDVAGQYMLKYHQTAEAYESGRLSVYYDGGNELAEYKREAGLQ